MRNVSQSRWCKRVGLVAVVGVGLYLAAPQPESDAGFFPLPMPPAGACELPDGSCQVMPESFCRYSGGWFQGPGTSCD